jgi:hypothetical protein
MNEPKLKRLASGVWKYGSLRIFRLDDPMSRRGFVYQVCRGSGFLQEFWSCWSLGEVARVCEHLERVHAALYPEGF